MLCAALLLAAFASCSSDSTVQKNDPPEIPGPPGSNDDGDAPDFDGTIQEYNGEKALEFLFKKPVFCYIYRIFFSLIVYVGAIISLDIVWSFSDIANALMIIPNLAALLILSGKLAKDTKEFQKVLKTERARQKANKV